jgi:predicted permease
MQTLLVLVPILAPVFIAAALGYSFTRWGGGFDSRFVARIVTNIFAPALVFHTLSATRVDPSHIFHAAGAILACMLAAGLAGFFFLKLLKVPVRTYLPSLIFPNLGNIGGPICLFAFGNEGLAYAVTVMAVGSVTLWTLGAWISSGTLSPLQILKTPPVPAAVLGAVFMVEGWGLPHWADGTLQLLAGATFPLMLLALGSSLATLKVRHLKLSLILGSFRIVVGTLIGVALVTALGFTGVLKGVIILQSGMPAAVFTYLFAQLYDRQPEEVAGVVVASTLMAAVTLPIMVAVVLGMQ